MDCSLFELASLLTGFVLVLVIFIIGSLPTEGSFNPFLSITLPLFVFIIISNFSSGSNSSDSSFLS